MSIPANIISEVAALNSAVAAAQPLSSAPKTTFATLAFQADQLATDTDTALSAAAGALDSWVADVMAPAIVTGFQEQVDAASTQLALADLRGVAGRVASNLTNG